MFACICRAVTSDDVSSAIDGGAASIRAVARATGAGTTCGSCCKHVRSLICERTHDCPDTTACLGHAAALRR